jgi:hypothetical protein
LHTSVTDSSSLSSFMDNMDGSMELGSGGGGSLGGIPGGRGMLGGPGGLASGAGSVPSSAANGGLNEKLAISAIQKSLMQFENVVKSPPQYPTQQMVRAF